jgi:hypothetical protein
MGTVLLEETTAALCDYCRHGHHEQPRITGCECLCHPQGSEPAPKVRALEPARRSQRAIIESYCKRLGEPQSVIVFRRFGKRTVDLTAAQAGQLMCELRDQVSRKEARNGSAR